MAENVRSPFDYREPPTLDSDGDGSKPPPPPPRGRVCGRKRKGTPVKVCDQAYVTEDEEEESLSEHSYSPGGGQYPEGAEDRLPPPGSPYYLADPSQLCVSELGEEGASGVRGPVLFHPPPNCRIREVHCGSQVRLVVIAIHDIAKGEEITVDYSLTDWGENAMGFHSSVSSRGFDCSFNPDNNIKKEEEPGPHPLSLSDYLTPSWSLSPSSSPLTHSEPSDSDREEDDDDDDDDEEEMEELRGRMLSRRKKRKIAVTVTTKKNSAANPRVGPGHPCSLLSSRLAASPAQTQSQAATTLAPPTTNINNNININIGSSSGATVSRRQHCSYCGRHYRSLARHLEKHHANQPKVRAAMDLATHHTHSSSTSSHPHSSTTTTSHGHTFASPQPSSSSAPAPPPPFSSERERDAPATRSSSGAVSFSLSLSAQSAVAKKGSNLSVQTPKQCFAPAVAPVKSLPTPARRGRRPKRAKEEQQKTEECFRSKEEEIPPRSTLEPEEEEPGEELELCGAGEGDSPGNKSVEMASSHRHHMPPLLSSLSCLVLFLRRQQHSSFLSLSRSPSSAEAWRLLCHSSLALLILYNRHRECEVAKLTTQDYHNRTTTPSPTQANLANDPPTGLEAILSPFEHQVLCHLPRAGVLGKRGRIQPLILPPHCEPCMELLLQTSANVGVDPHSPYVFSRPFHSPATPLRGTDLLRNLARASGAKNPGVLTQTRVRRQVAILTQLLLLEEGEGQGLPSGAAGKRLEDFLQREYHVTQSCTTIGRDPALMGHVGRVVLYGERQGVLFKGMSLQHICLELDVMSGNSADSFSGDSDGEAEKVEVVKKRPGRPPRKKKGPPPSVNPPLPGAHKRRSIQPKSGKRGVLKRPWSEAERVAVETHLKRNIMELRVPAKADCERCLHLCPLLVSNQRDWRAIKFYCHNRIQLLKKQGRKESAGQGALC
ncbi:uncharacterized protein LOC112260118 isoform X1 [Oncorhynchus tshawytscha]|uniref:uncharacterized protein LOC112260118 isoform X1 n=2 Tax=Oncorhynchus tshawytscha TaxID=74940 RepID=UPI000D09E0D1|nr:uncharacterized protein LOC112260118 isoform X1 [Oncorhynchus tshawytscha]